MAERTSHRMSKMRSSKFARGTAVSALAVAAMLSGCNRPVDVHSEAVRGVGYIRIDDVVKKHPLYGQLSQIDSNIDALSLRTLAPSVPKTGAQIARETSQLNKELSTAQQRTNRLLAQKQSEYAQREQAAIRAAIAASGENPGTAPAQAMQNAAAAQAANVSAQAQSDFSQYQSAVLAQDRAAVQAVQTQLLERASRQFRQKSDELSAKESQTSLELANRDSAQRLSLRTKLNNLALDDALRAQTKAQLAALDRREADAVTVMRNRDAATLAAYQTQLRKQTDAEIIKQAQAIHQQTSAKLQARHNSVGSQVAAQINGLSAAAAPAGGHLSAGTQAKIAAIDKQYKAQFQADVRKTIEDFTKTRTDLDARFAALHGADAGAQGLVGKQLSDLHKQRDQLYSQIVAQIQREVQTMAAQRGLKVVFINLVAPVGGIDLTDDAEKDVESLHE